MIRPQASGSKPQASGSRLQASGSRFRASDFSRRLALGIVLALALPVSAQQPDQTPIRGLSNGVALAQAYDAILDADFAVVRARLGDTCEEVRPWCDVMRAVSLWWQIAIDPEDRQYDEAFTDAVETAIEASEAWTEREPLRAEAWFARGAAYGARAQWRVERRERLAAARDGKHIKAALERAIELDPALHDAKFGIGMYRYYADVAPAAFKFLRWLLLLPGGDRKGGLEQMQAARDEGFVVRGEADYQLHLIYLWYEDRPADALALIRSLQARYPHNPLFALDEAKILDAYFHDTPQSEAVLRALIADAQASRVHRADAALARARTMLAALQTRKRR